MIHIIMQNFPMTFGIIVSSTIVTKKNL